MGAGGGGGDYCKEGMNDSASSVAHLGTSLLPWVLRGENYNNCTWEITTNQQGRQLGKPPKFRYKNEFSFVGERSFDLVSSTSCVSTVYGAKMIGSLSKV